jgi:hypothetical protein
LEHQGLLWLGERSMSRPLLQVIAIFCDFWSFDPAALGLLHAAGANDPEFEASVHERNERRRRLLSVLVGRMAEDRQLRPKTIGDFLTVDRDRAKRRGGLPAHPRTRVGCCAAGDRAIKQRILR